VAVAVGAGLWRLLRRRVIPVPARPVADAEPPDVVLDR
jgi:hypothetical protein